MEDDAATNCHFRFCRRCALLCNFSVLSAEPLKGVGTSRIYQNNLVPVLPWTRGKHRMDYPSLQSLEYAWSCIIFHRDTRDLAGMERTQHIVSRSACTLASLPRPSALFSHDPDAVPVAFGTAADYLGSPFYCLW